MAPLNPKALLQAAMATGGSGAPPPGLQTPSAPGAGGLAAGPQGGMQDALPGNLAGAQPVGAETSGVLSTPQLQEQLGVGAETGAAGGDQTQEAIAAIQDPQVPDPIKQRMQQQLQLAALASLTSGPTGAVGTG